MRLVNLTPHALVLRDSAGEDHTIPPSGQVARVRAIPSVPEEVAGIPVPVYDASRFGAVVLLPELALAQDAASWLGERERSVAWTWLRG